jgi:hypothetical protein
MDKMRTILYCDQATIRPVNDNDFQTVGIHRLEFNQDGHRYRIILKDGTLTDGASVPRLFWSLIPPYGRHFISAIFHDELYRRNCFGLVEKLVNDKWVLVQPGQDILKNCRRFADEIFRDVMEYFQVPQWKRATMYRAVRWFGWKAY